jgi:hypothetical protein
LAGLTPEPGLVIPFHYLWRREHEAGEESGRKARPCVVVVAVVRGPGDRLRVAVSPVTSRDPGETRAAVEIPPRVKRHLGLDAVRSWVICDEHNEFDWPGLDGAVTPSGKAAYGYIPDALVDRVRAEVRAALRRGGLKGVPR